MNIPALTFWVMALITFFSGITGLGVLVYLLFHVFIARKGDDL